MHRQPMTDPARIYTLSEGSPGRGPVVYWMGREQRAQDNWALLHACEIALATGRPLLTVFLLVEGFAAAPLRHYAFMLDGLEETAAELAAHGIPFRLIHSRKPDDTAPLLQELHRIDPHTLISDFDPLRLRRSWKQIPVSCTHLEVDAHNIVPCRSASDKREYAAYTIRPKIHRQLSRFLTGFPPLPKLSRRSGPVTLPDWARIRQELTADPSVGPVSGIRPGSAAADKHLKQFLQTGITGYDTLRNDPLADGQSGLSPWLHFGQLAPQRAAWEASLLPETPDRDAFLEELVIRRELADNFCFYEPHYDSADAFPAWARQTIAGHRLDPREIYSYEALAAGRSPDPLWNAAQLQMVHGGKMHGYMRMYWAKQLLLWTPDAATALHYANTLNDRFSLDGRDPNGYAGTAWSIGGVHDRAWPSRQVFGKIRCMNSNGCRRKFDVKAYTERYAPPPDPTGQAPLFDTL